MERDVGDEIKLQHHSTLARSKQTTKDLPFFAIVKRVGMQKMNEVGDERLRLDLEKVGHSLRKKLRYDSEDNKRLCKKRETMQSGNSSPQAN
jgi:hypothetical protein